MGLRLHWALESRKLTALGQVGLGAKARQRTQWPAALVVPTGVVCKPLPQPAASVCVSELCLFFGPET